MSLPPEWIHEYFECDCNSMEHVFRMVYWPDDSDWENTTQDYKDSIPYFISMEIQPQTFRTFWERIRYAVQYIFGVGQGHCVSEVLITKETAQKMIKMLERL